MTEVPHPQRFAAAVPAFHRRSLRHDRDRDLATGSTTMLVNSYERLEVSPGTRTTINGSKIRTPGEIFGPSWLTKGGSHERPSET